MKPITARALEMLIDAFLEDPEGLTEGLVAWLKDLPQGADGPIGRALQMTLLEKTRLIGVVDGKADAYEEISSEVAKIAGEMGDAQAVKQLRQLAFRLMAQALALSKESLDASRRVLAEGTPS